MKQRGIWRLLSVQALSMAMALAVIGTHPAAAQGQANSSDDSGIQEVIVTAQKHEQSAQQVAITMSVLTAAALAESNVNTAVDLVNVVPNLEANYGGGQTMFNMRGIGSNLDAAAVDSPIAVNLDEVYLAKNFMVGLMMFDLDRVEALQGPQGTLFGRNATGGAINFFSKRPTNSLSFGATIGYGDYQTVHGEAYVSGPITDELTGRLSASAVNQRQGFYQDVFTGGSQGFDRRAAVRGQLQWKSDNSLLLFTTSFGQETGQLPVYQGAGVFTPDSVASGQGVYCPAFLAGRPTAGNPQCVRSADGLNASANPYVTSSNLPNDEQHRLFSIALRAEHELGWARLVSLSSYQHATRVDQENSEGTPANILNIYYNNRIDELTQEVRLVSSGGGPWDYVLGGYFEHDSYGNGDYLVFDGDGTGYYSLFKMQTRAAALFFHNEVKLNEQLSLIAGMRYSNEQVHLNGGTLLADGLNVEKQPTQILSVVSDANAVPTGPSRHDKDTTFKVGVGWRPELSSLSARALMLYATVSTGFRSGTFDPNFNTTQESLTSLSPETITTYEAGIKSILADKTLQLNAAFFSNDFRNGFIDVDTPGSIIPLFVNAATIESYGAQVEALWEPVRRLTLGLTGGWLESTIGSDLTVSGVPLNGKRTAQSPEFTSQVHGSYDLRVGDRLLLGLSATANWRASQYFEVTNTQASLQPSYWLVDARLRLHTEDDRWAVSAWAKNLTGSEYHTYTKDLASSFGFVLNIFGPPRTFGLDIAYKF